MGLPTQNGHKTPQGKSARSGLRAKCGAFPPVAIATNGGKRRHVDGEQPRDSPANLNNINLSKTPNKSVS